MTEDDPGLLGGLPRSRPGTRSSRRDDPSAAPRGAPPEPRGAPAPRRPAARTGPEPSDSEGPVGEAVRSAARGAEAGLKVAQAVTREVLRRLPRL